MGIKGTEVLADDKIGSITAAVEEGRTVSTTRNFFNQALQPPLQRKPSFPWLPQSETA
jgi:hypothetical protein